MPTYQITDPDTGIKLRITGDSPPSEQELEEIFAAQRQQAATPEAEPGVEAIPTGIAGVTEQKFSQAEPVPEPTLGEQAVGLGETALTLGTGATTGALGFVAGAGRGIAEEILTGKFGEGIAERMALEGASAGTFAPRTAAGQEMVETVGETLGALPPVIAPLMAETIAVSNIPTIVRSGTRLINDDGTPTPALEKALDKQGLVYENLTTESKGSIPEFATPGAFERTKSAVSSASESALKEQIKAKGRDESLSGLKLKGDSVVPDKAGLEAMKQGYEPGIVQMAKTATPETKASMSKMVTIMQRVKSNPRLTVRPSDEAGRAVIDRANFVRGKMDKARLELDRIATKELKGIPVETAPVIDRLGAKLDDIGVVMTETPEGKIKPVFEDSVISKVPSAQKAIRNLTDLVTRKLQPDALSFHMIKREIDGLVDFSKQPGRGVGAEGERALRDIRVILNDAIREKHQGYADVNDTLSRSIGALDELQKSVGTKANLKMENAEKAVGTRLRALLSNQQGRAQMENALNEVDSLSSDLGGKFKTDYQDLITFANALDRRHGAVARTSLAGEIEGAGGKVIGAAEQLATQGVPVTAATAAFGALKKLDEKRKGISDFNAFQSMKKLLGEQQ